MEIKLALAHLAESRSEFLELRRPLIDEELASLDWLRNEFHCIESGLINTAAAVRDFASRAAQAGAHALVMHVPVWGEPAMVAQLDALLRLPVLLLGNMRPETSSMVGLLGAGGALDQVGCQHLRVFDSHTRTSQQTVRAFARAAAARYTLRGQTLGLFGSRSLGIITAVADPAQWQRLFGMDIEIVDQAEIMQLAEALPAEEAARHTRWLVEQLGGVEFGNGFTPLALERQVRSYLATRRLAQEHGFDLVGVKCQPELSDGYVSQCVAHLLFNSDRDADGAKPITIHACESDADGALTMHLLNLLSGGQPAALLDIRWYDPTSGLWTLANCGAVPPGLCATPHDRSGLSQVRMQPHTFGKGGGGALPAVLSPGQVTLARLCRRNGSYWMAILPAEVVPPDADLLNRVTPAFPKGLLRTAAGADFLQTFGSNHIHLVPGDFCEELQLFCELAGIPFKIWK